MFVVNEKIIVYNSTELIEISNRGVTDIDFTLTFTYIGFEYV